MRQPPKLSRNQRRKRDYKAMAATGGESRSAKRARLKAQRVARRPDQRGAHERPCGNVACRSCYRHGEHRARSDAQAWRDMANAIWRRELAKAA